MEAKVKRRRLNCKAFSPVYKDVERFNEENCGACLLPLIDESENTLTDLLLIGKTDLCDHLFHANCLKTWSTRDTSCPQCRLRFNYLGVYKLTGSLEETKRVPQVFLGDILDEEEDDDDDDDEDDDGDNDDQDIRDDDTEEYTVNESDIDFARALSRSGENAAPGRQNEEGTSLAASRQRVNRKLRLEVQRMRAQLASERRRELCEQQRILDRVDPEVVKLSILRSLKRLPYQFKPRGSEVTPVAAKIYINRTGKTACVQIPTEQSRMVVPRLSPGIKNNATSAERFSRLRKPAQYEEDFLLKQGSKK